MHWSYYSLALSHQYDLSFLCVQPLNVLFDWQNDYAYHKNTLRIILFHFLQVTMRDWEHTSLALTVSVCQTWLMVLFDLIGSAIWSQFYNTVVLSWTQLISNKVSAIQTSICKGQRSIDNLEHMVRTKKSTIRTVSTPHYLTFKHWEMHECVVSTVATDALVLKHQAIGIHNAD